LPVSKEILDEIALSFREYQLIIDQLGREPTRSNSVCSELYGVSIAAISIPKHCSSNSHLPANKYELKL